MMRLQAIPISYRDYILRMLEERRRVMRVDPNDPEDRALMRAIKYCPGHFADVSITAANVLLVSGYRPKVGLFALETLAAGDWLYQATGTSTVGKTDCDASGVDDSKSITIGMALNTALAIGAPVSYAAAGDRVTIGSVVSRGNIYVLSGTAGKMCDASDLADSDWVTIAAVGVDASTIEIIAEPLQFLFTKPAAIAVASGPLIYGAPANGNTVVFTGPSGGPHTFTKAASGSATEFSTIGELEALIEALTGVNSTHDGTRISITVASSGTGPNSWTVTGTGIYSALYITFSGGN